MQKFAEMKLSASTLNALAVMGFESPTEIQILAIPRMLDGRDVIAQARTGTGKTAAFGVPLVEKLAGSVKSGVVALVLVPTRELALQVAQEAQEIARGTPLRFVTVYGGVGFGPQAEALRKGGPIVVVATPGRLLDHLSQRTVRLDQVRVLVLDEADRMLDMGFLPDVEKIIRSVPAQRQTALFSATVPDEIRRLCMRFLRDPVVVKAEVAPEDAPIAEHFRVDVDRRQKPAALLGLLREERPACAIVFTRTKHLAKRLARDLERERISVTALQGNMSQSARERAMRAFRDGKVSVLVATDVAARGIDVIELSHVINYDIPEDPVSYVHRVGRTGRMGRTGRAFTFVEPDQEWELNAIEHKGGFTLAAYAIPGLQAPPQGRGEHRQHGRERRPAPGQHQRFTAPPPQRDGRPTLVWDDSAR